LDTTKGVLTINWKKYDKKNFVSYQVMKCFADFSNCQYTDIMDNTTTSWTDTDYVGGNVTYEIRIKTTLYDFYETPAIRKEYNWSPKFTVAINDDIATVKWSKPLFYLNTKKVTIVAPGIRFETAISDTTYISSEKLSFGPGYGIALKFYSNREDQSTTYNKGIFIGDRHEWQSELPQLYNSKADLYYGQDINRQTIVMNNKLEVVHTAYANGQRFVSANGEYFITLLDNNFYLTDPLTLETTLTLATGDTYVQGVTVADNGLIGFYAYGIYKVVSLASGEVKFVDESYVSSYSVLSPSGNYLIGKDQKTYHYNGTTFDYEGTLPNINKSLYYFKFGKNDNIFTVASYLDGSGNTDLIEFDINSRTIANTLSSGSGPLQFQIDPVTGKILFSHSYTDYLLSSTSGIKKVISENNGDRLSILNDHLFARGLYEFFSIPCSHIEN